MRVLYFQPFSGASGDMILGALCDLGLPLERLTEALATLHLDGWRIEARKEMRGPLHATRVRVHVAGEAGPRNPPARGRAPEPAPPWGHPQTDEAAPDPSRLVKSEPPGRTHAHDHAHDHAHVGAHARDPEAGRSPGKGHVHGTGSAHRHLGDILETIESSGLPRAVKDSAAAVFQRLAEAEARVHGQALEEVHFHEVGAVDSIVDIVGACAGIHLLGVSEVWSAPVTVGTGLVRSAHGELPLPAPATLELLRGFPVEQRDSRSELTTPTGAALLTTLSKGFGTLPPLEVSAVGYGAGDERPGSPPNVLRAILGERPDGAPGRDRIVLLETNVDDMSPQWLGHLMDRLFEAGALDVTISPLLMKKSRPGHELRAMATLEAEPRVLETLLRESTTFGVRRCVVDRVILDRELRPVETPWGTVRVKIGLFRGRAVSAAPEYEDLRAAATRARLPLKEVHETVMQAYRALSSAAPPGTS